MSLIPGFCSEYVPTVLSEKYPIILTDLEDQTCIDMKKEDLLKHCEKVAFGISVSKEESVHVEMTTKTQSSCKEWHRFRAGCITASRLHAVHPLMNHHTP